MKMERKFLTVLGIMLIAGSTPALANEVNNAKQSVEVMKNNGKKINSNIYIQNSKRTQKISQLNSLIPKTDSDTQTTRNSEDVFILSNYNSAYEINTVMTKKDLQVTEEIVTNLCRQIDLDEWGLSEDTFMFYISPYVLYSSNHTDTLINGYYNYDKNRQEHNIVIANGNEDKEVIIDTILHELGHSIYYHQHFNHNKTLGRKYMELYPTLICGLEDGWCNSIEESFAEDFKLYMVEELGCESAGYKRTNGGYKNEEVFKLFDEYKDSIK